MLQHHRALAQLHRQSCVLFDQQQRHAVRADLAQNRKDALDHDRRQAHARLVEEQQARAAHQRSSNRQHLLLAARQRAALLPRAVAQDGKQPMHAIEIARDGHRVAAAVRAHLQVLAHGQAREDATTLGHVRQPARHHLVRGQRADVAALELEQRAATAQDARDAAKGAALARTVGADQAHDLAAMHLQAHLMQHIHGSVARRQILHLQHGLAHPSSSLPR